MGAACHVAVQTHRPANRHVVSLHLSANYDGVYYGLSRNCSEKRSASLRAKRRRTGWPARAARSPPFQTTLWATKSPVIGVQSSAEKPDRGFPVASCTSTRVGPLLVIFSERADPVKVSGFVRTSPPSGPARADTNPSTRNTKRRTRLAGPA